MIVFYTDKNIFFVVRCFPEFLHEPVKSNLASGVTGWIDKRVCNKDATGRIFFIVSRMNVDTLKLRNVQNVRHNFAPSVLVRQFNTVCSRWYRCFVLNFYSSGNDKEDTPGCILVADTLVNPSRNAGSKIAFDRLMGKFRTATDNREDILISVENYVSIPL